METKKVFFTEAAYLAGIIFLALGTALMERADFGMSMVVAPAYLVYLKVSQTLTWFTFGMAEYMLQALLLLIMGLLLRSFKLSYLGSFLTAVFYGVVLDGMMKLVAWIPFTALSGRFLFFLSGMFFCSLGIAFLFHTYIAPEAYELIVIELVHRYDLLLRNVKTAYDCTSLFAAVLLSFAFFGLWHLEGVWIGTFFCALLNGSLISFINKYLERIFVFRDGLRRKTA